MSGTNVGITGLPFTAQFAGNNNHVSGGCRRGIVGGEWYQLEGLLDNATSINVIRKYNNTGLSDGNQSFNGFFMYTTA